MPGLINGKTLEEALAQYLGMKVVEENQASLKIYVHTLLINSQGKCETIYTSPSRRREKQNDFYGDYDNELKNEIEKWVMEQVFQTKTFPKGFSKYKYSDFIYLK